MDFNWSLANFFLNLLFVPLLKILWDIRNELTRINGKVASQEHRLNRLERMTDERLLRGRRDDEASQ